MISTSLEVWVTAICIIIAFSILWKDNLIFRIASHLMVGLSVGYTWVASIKGINHIGIEPLLAGDLFYIIPLTLGVLLFLSLTKKYSGISLYPLAIVFSTSVVLVGRSAIDAMVIKEIGQMSLSLFPSTLSNFINNYIIIVFCFLGIFYFYFSREMTGSLKKLNTIGRYALVIIFGAAYGGTVMSRLSVLITQLGFLVKVWLGF